MQPKSYYNWLIAGIVFTMGSIILGSILLPPIEKNIKEYNSLIPFNCTITNCTCSVFYPLKEEKYSGIGCNWIDDKNNTYDKDFLDYRQPICSDISEESMKDWISQVVGKWKSESKGFCKAFPGSTYILQKKWFGYERAKEYVAVTFLFLFLLLSLIFYGIWVYEYRLDKIQGMNVNINNGQPNLHPISSLDLENVYVDIEDSTV